MRRIGRAVLLFGRCDATSKAVRAHMGVMGKNANAITRVLRSRTAIVLLMFALVGDVLCVGSRSHTGSDYQSILTPIVGRFFGWSCSNWGSIDGVVVCGSGGAYTLISGVDLGELVIEELLERGDLVVFVRFSPWFGESGIWAPTSGERNARLSFDVLKGRLDPNARLKVGRFYLDRHPRLSDPFYGWVREGSSSDAFVMSGSLAKKDVQYAGVAHNALSLAMLCSLIHGIRARMRWKYRGQGGGDVS